MNILNEWSNTIAAQRDPGSADPTKLGFPENYLERHQPNQEVRRMEVIERASWQRALLASEMRRRLRDF